MIQALFKITSIAYWLALALWIAAIVAVAIAAMNTFGTLPDPDLGVHLAPFAAYPANEHGRLAAGIVMERNFFVADMIQLFSIPVVLVMLVAQLVFFGMKWSKPANLLRTICLLAAGSLFGYYAFTMAPTMNHELRAYWDAAKAGNLEEADAHRTSFDVLHPKAEAILKLDLVLVVVGIGASAAAYAGLVNLRYRPRTELEEPRLNRTT